MSYTPGPWRVYAEHDVAYGEIGECHTVHLILSHHPLCVVTEESKANAALISAAPDLLRACKQLLSLSLPVDVSGQRMVDEAVAAVAKAEGKL